MTAPPTDLWLECNQRALGDALERVSRALRRHIARAQGTPEAETEETLPPQEDRPAAPSALERLCTAFHLSAFERDILLLCAGAELDSGFAALCATAQGDSQRPWPTFSLALAALPEAHWTALTPAAPLRRARLIELGAGSTLTLRPLRISERALHYLLGVDYLEERLAGLVEPVAVPEDLVPSHRRIVERLIALLSPPEGAVPAALPPVIQLCGEDAAGKRAVAAAACAEIGLNLCALPAEALPTNPAEMEELLALWGREATLRASALLLDCEEADLSEMQRAAAVRGFIERSRGVLLLAARDRLRARQRLMVAFDVHRPGTAEQRLLWQQTLGTVATRLNGQIEALASQFNISAQTIRAAGAEALGRLAAADAAAPIGEIGGALWEACRIQARPRLDDVAQRIEPAADWDELVLPEGQKRILRDIAAHVRQRATVYETWGFAGKGGRGLGMSALFAGASGTGKTMAAEALARELHLDLYRIDLSSVVSKYIGETEKNLRRVFDAAEEGGAILLFDEADALFGKRSEVKDSHDRYANIEVSYLLQRMECYRGLAILTTNMKSALDTAFLRRLRFIVQFPFPDAAQRAEIWRRVFPRDTPTEGLDIAKLARLNVAGGNIRSVALNAAFLAADAGEAVRMTHLLRAAQSEYAKLEKPLTEAEVAGWV
ncbi:MAG TPA: ATP-binding protein [Chthonomonadaceae bacterium]|nr:ATP-binding protein [Chthonomonadaceae bacterium]